MIYLIDLEYVETRYTAQWKTQFPLLMNNADLPCTIIAGPENIAECTTPGAFLNFSGTNIYKAEQVRKIAELFTENRVKDGDKFVFADAWHPGIINLKYMSELLDINIETHGLWHAGSYDPNDFLGRKIGAAKWVRNAEKSFFEAFDYNWFASHDHIDMFIDRLLELELDMGRMHYMPKGKISRTGWPMHYLKDTIQADITSTEKEDLILFPHRIAPEKQPEIFRDLQTHLPEFKLVFCQEQELTKAEYHKLLGKAKMVFSANKQETLGIGCYEILCAGGMPLVPDNLSYTEMYVDGFKYPVEWIEKYPSQRDELVTRIRSMMTEYDKGLMLNTIEDNYNYLNENYFSATELLNVLKG